MQTEGLQIILTSQVTDAIRGLTSVTNAFEELGSEAADALAEASDAISNLGKGNVSINRLTQALGVFRTAANNATDPSKLAQYQQSIIGIEGELARLNSVGRQAANGGIANAGSAIQNLGRVASDAPFGFIAIQNNLDPLFDSFRRLSTASGGLGGALKALVSGLSGGAGIGLAFTLISSLTTTLIQKYGSLGNAISALTGNFTAAQKLSSDFAKELTKTTQAAGDQYAKIVLLQQIINDSNETQKDRTRAVEEYNKIADHANQIDLKQIDNLDKANALIQAQINLIGQRALAQAAVNKLGEIAGKLLDVQLRNAPIINQYTDAQNNSLGKQNEQLQAVLSSQKQINNNKINVGSLTGLDSAGVAKAAKDASKSAQIQFRLTFEKPEFDKAQAAVKAAQDEFNKALNQLGPLTDIDGLTTKDTKTKATKNVKSLSDVLKKLDDDLVGLDSSFNLTGGTIDSLVKDKLTVLTNAFKELSDFGVLPGTKIFEKYRAIVTALQADIQKNVVDLNPFKIPLTIAPLSNKTSNLGSVVRVLKGVNDSFKPQLDAFSAELNKNLEASIESGLSGIGEGIGQALTGGGLQGILSAFVDSIANFGVKLGTQLIATGVALEAFNSSLASLQGAGAIIAGVALIAASTAFKSLAGGGVKKYATGGVAEGTQLAVIGDNPGRKEAVIPSELWGKMGGGGDINVETRISANDLLILIKRAERNG